MKKIVMIISLFFMISLTGCNAIESKTQIIEYDGKTVNKLMYETIDYMGGFKDIRIIDFIDNNYYFQTYIPEGFDDEGYSELDLRRNFTEKEEKIFIDACYSYGLFDLDDFYQETGIDDGGGWTLIIEYEDGTTKVSRGDNAGPDEVFKKCSIYFYDLCGEKVFNYLPEFYLEPPTLMARFGNKRHWYGSAKIIKANYKWNKTKSLDNDLFLINDEIKEYCEFQKDKEYNLLLFTKTYRYKVKFKEIRIIEYDFNSELSNEKVIYTGKWFKELAVSIELNKIYVYELIYEDGNYVQYTFSTYYAD